MGIFFILRPFRNYYLFRPGIKLRGISSSFAIDMIPLFHRPLRVFFLKIYRWRITNIR